MSKTFKTACIVCCLCLLVCGLTAPVYAASTILAGNYDPADYIHDISISGDTKTIRYDFSSVYGGWFIWERNSGSSEISMYEFDFELVANSEYYTINYFPFGDPFDVTTKNLSSPAHGCLYVGDILPGSSIDYDFLFVFDVTWDNFDDVIVDIDLHYYHYLDCYDKNGAYIETLTIDAGVKSYTVDVGSAGLELHNANFSGSFPANAVYVRPRLRFSVYSDPALDMHIRGMAGQIDLSVDLNTVLENSNQMAAIKNKLDDLNVSIGDVNDKLDQILQQPEQEKNDASQGANDAFSGVVDVVPDHSEGLADAFSGLASSMSYNGTVAKLDIPAVSMPGLDGLFDGFVVMQPQQIDFEVYFDMLPDNLLLLVQSLLTGALIIFCFKELYGTIQYCMILRG